MAQVDARVCLLVGAIERLGKSSAVISKTEMRWMRNLVMLVLSALRTKAQQWILECPDAPTMATYSSDGWGAKVGTYSREEVGPHVRVDQRGTSTTNSAWSVASFASDDLQELRNCVL